MTQKSRDLVSAALLAVLAVATFWVARGIEPRLPAGVDSGFFPEVVSVALLIVAVIIAGNGVRRAKLPPKTGTGDAGARRARPNPLRVGISVLLVSGFVLILPYLGFVVSALFFLLAQITVLAPPDERSLPMIGLVSVVASVGIYVVFALGFGLILPRGPF